MSEDAAQDASTRAQSLFARRSFYDLVPQAPIPALKPELSLELEVVLGVISAEIERGGRRCPPKVELALLFCLECTEVS